MVCLPEYKPRTSSWCRLWRWGRSVRGWSRAPCTPPASWTRPTWPRAGPPPTWLCGAAPPSCPWSGTWPGEWLCTGRHIATRICSQTTHPLMQSWNRTVRSGTTVVRAGNDGPGFDFSKIHELLKWIFKTSDTYTCKTHTEWEISVFFLAKQLS